MTLGILSATCGLVVTVFGAQGRLGRELVSQALEQGWNVQAVVRRPDDGIPSPVRTGLLTESKSSVPDIIVNRRLSIVDATDKMPPCDAMVFALSGAPFTVDDSTSLVHKAIASMEERCRRVCMVSAHGVGDSIERSNVGIKVMRGWYLKSVYESKREQEDLVRALQCDVRIIRPKVLSIERSVLLPEATTRYDLAHEIVEWIAEKSS